MLMESKGLVYRLHVDGSSLSFSTKCMGYRSINPGYVKLPLVMQMFHVVPLTSFGFIQLPPLPLYHPLRTLGA